ncbi:uncharacterized protein EI90DRAFT_3061779 [Cantharellus anzutake]|uniref:uncharacterized protein n=1 Tax=Cantharellus anzutake TaxID=1750568 RepID=UPI00190365B1|nr:uncharacterized protein EI90DRAFT_3061779 [Cantharellus anzutake]KAF8329750.1 hypothetical protein EI90DRAFT_3061779 [Cantharellus anzutake]
MRALHDRNPTPVLPSSLSAMPSQAQPSSSLNSPIQIFQTRLPAVDQGRLAGVLERQRKQHSRYFGIGRPANETILYGPVNAIVNAVFPENSLYRPMQQYTLEDGKRDQRELLRPDITVVTDTELFDQDSDSLTCLVIEVKNKPLSAKDRKEDTKKAVDQLYRYMIDAYQKRHCPSVLYGIAIVGFRMYLYQMMGIGTPMIHVESGFAPNFLDNSAAKLWTDIRNLVDDEVREKSLTWPRATRSLNSSVGVAQQDADMERPQDTMGGLFEDVVALRFPPMPEPKDPNVFGAASYLPGLSPTNTDSTGPREIESPIQLRSADRVGETLSYTPFFDFPAPSNLSSDHRVDGTPHLRGSAQWMFTPQPGQKRPFHGFQSMPAAHSGGMPLTPGAPSDLPLQPVGTPSSPSLLMPPLESAESPLHRFSTQRRQLQITNNVSTIGILVRDQDRSSGQGEPGEAQVPQGGAGWSPSYAANVPRIPEPISRRAITDWHTISASHAPSTSSQPHNFLAPNIASHSPRHLRVSERNVDEDSPDTPTPSTITNRSGQGRQSDAQPNHPNFGGRSNKRMSS